ncbi:MAG: sugar phosphate isomerase/epimerase [Oscillospiraceae bacterium]|nr:sugar phosphate isomerase/epimerase [Oscillospiraceae bacterium]
MFLYGVSASLEELPAAQPVTLRGSIDAVCAEAAEIGYDAIELHLREPARYDAAQIKKTAGSYNLAVCAIANGMEYTIGGLCLIDDDQKKRGLAMARMLEHADLAAMLGARLIVGMMRGNIPKGGDLAKYQKRFELALAQICEYAEKKRVLVVIESILRYISNYLNGVPETMDFITEQKKDNLSLHIDTHSMAIEEKNLSESILYCKNKPLGYVHYSDNNRMYPGGGALDFKQLTRALADIGYEGYITLECLPYPDQKEAARRGLDYMKSVERAVCIERYNRR